MSATLLCLALAIAALVAMPVAANAAPPAPPSYTVAVASDTSVTVNWTALPAGATGVQIRHWAETNPSVYSDETVVDSNPSGSTLVTSLATGVRQFFRVRSTSSEGPGAWSAATAILVRTAPPAAPSMSLAVASSNSVNVSWSGLPSGGTGVEVRYWPETNSAAYSTSTIVDSSASGSTAITGLTTGIRYYFRIRTTDASGGGNWSGAQAILVRVGPPAPPVASLVVASNTSLTVNWTDVPVGATGVQLRYWPETNSSAYVDQTVPGASSAGSTVLNGLTTGIRYFLRIRSYDAVGAGPWANPVVALVRLTPPAPPTLSLSAASASSITASWSDLPGAATGVELRYWEETVPGNSGPLTTVAFPSATSSTTVEGLTTGETYYFRIRSTDSVGAGEWSAKSSVSLASAPETTIGDAPASTPITTPAIPVSTDTGTSYECQINDAPVGWTACDPNAGDWGSASFTDVSANKVAIRAVGPGGADATPDVTHIWVSTASVSAVSSVSVTGGDGDKAGGHPGTVSGDITLNGGYNAKSVTVNMPFGLNGALTGTSEVCDASGGDAEAMDCAATAPGSAIGTISGTGVSATAGTITDATSTIYLTSAPADQTAPAGVWVDVKSPSHPELGHIRAFGWVNITQVDSGVINGEIRQQIVVPNIPEVTSAGDRFHANSVHLELLGDPPGGTFPLITNPTTCDTHTFVGTGTTWSSDLSGGDGDPVPETTAEYPVSDCATLEFSPTLVQDYYMMNPIDGSTYDMDDPAAGLASVGTALDTNLVDVRRGQAGTIATVDFGAPSTTARRASIKSMQVLQPQGTGANYAAFAGPGSQCPGSAATSTGIFDFSSCLPGAKVGTVTVDTPLLADPLIGDVYLIQNNPLPWLGIHIAPDTNPNGTNPAGVFLNLTATTDLTCSADVVPCNDAQFKRVTIVVNNMPDVPMNSVTMDLSGATARSHDSLDAPLPTLMLQMPDAGSGGCKPSDAIYSTMNSGEGVVLDAQQATTMSHCALGAASPTLTKSVPVGTTTNLTTATLNLVANDANQLYCKLDQAPWAPCSAGTINLTGLSEGQHTYSARALTPDGLDGSNPANITWLVDSVAPTLTLTRTSASNAANATFAWTRNENGSFTCDKDNTTPGTFTSGECSPAVNTSTRSGTQTWTAVPAGNRTFSVRITDAAGNVATQSVSWVEP